MAKIERALRKLMAEDDAVLWGAEPPEGPARRRLPPLPPRASAPPAPAQPAVERDPPRAKQVARPTPAQVAAVLPLRPPTRKPDSDDTWPLWERA